MTRRRGLTGKKLLLFAVLAVVLYMGSGVALIAMGAIDRFYFWPGWSIKGPKADADKSGFAADGPVVTSQGNALLSKQIISRRGRLVLVADTLGLRDTIDCYVDATKQAFRVPLRGADSGQADEYPMPKKLLAVSDIEGNFKGLAGLLRGAGVVDERLAWRFGRGHVVLVGDFFDRGLNVTECLWLIYGLEQQAERAGGKVHFIMGNHERMNLMGHLKYLRRKYRVSADTLGVPYEEWYSPRTVLGRWLRTKNVVERIGSVLFVHGGISPVLAGQGLPLARLNEWARKSLDVPNARLTAAEKQATLPPESPDWYRGLALEEATAAEVAQVLRTYSATTLVIGHTPSETIRALYDGRVVAIDMPHQERTDAGKPLQALWMEGGRMRVVDSQGKYAPLAGVAQ